MKRNGWGLAAAGVLAALALTGCETSRQACEREKRYNDRLAEMQWEMDSRLDQLHGQVAGFRHSPPVDVRSAPAPVTVAPAPFPTGDIIYTGEPDIVVWTPPPPPRPAPATNLAAKHIRVNQPVTRVQSALREYGSYKGAIDGRVGPQTIAAIQAFQRGNGLAADGVVGPRTWAALEPYAPALAGGGGRMK